MLTERVIGAAHLLLRAEKKIATRQHISQIPSYDVPGSTTGTDASNRAASHSNEAGDVANVDADERLDQGRRGCIVLVGGVA